MSQKIFERKMKTYTTNIEVMLQEGYTERFAKCYLTQVEKESTMSCYNQEYALWAHDHGFYAESACSYGLNDNNFANYLTDYDYYKVWPLNGWTRIWINDKLTLKQLWDGSEFGELMPKYYFYTAQHGLLSLMDNPNKEGSVANFVQTLKKVGTFACKPCNGTTAIGFFALSYREGKFYFNEDEIEECQFEQIITDHPNYIFTEYIRPAQYLKKYSDQIHTLRIVTLNSHGDNPIIAGGYLRFPNKNNGEANYSVLGEKDIDRFNLFVELNPETGWFGNAKKTFINKVESTSIHPDTGAIIDGYIRNFDKLKQMVLGIAQRFNTLEWMGFDIGVTENGFKCMEINSHPGIKYMQIFHPFFENPLLERYFKSRIEKMKLLTKEQMRQRNHILR